MYIIYVADTFFCNKSFYALISILFFNIICDTLSLLNFNVLIAYTCTCSRKWPGSGVVVCTVL